MPRAPSLPGRRKVHCHCAPTASIATASSGTVTNWFQTKRPGASMPADLLHAIARRNETHRSEEQTSELQSLMRSSYAGFGLKKQKQDNMGQVNYGHQHGDEKSVRDETPTAERGN